MYLLGVDVGSSSVKASILDSQTGRCVGSGQSPDSEMAIQTPQPGWAEQDPADWWLHAVKAIRAACAAGKLAADEIGAVGIAYQMHGLVCLDGQGTVLRPAIIWCDSRAVETGNRAFEELGAERCLGALLNSPGNFTASKLRWVKENEPEVFAQIRHFLLPGDYLAYRMTGRVATTVSGLSEGISWDFSAGQPADFLLDHYGIPREWVPELVPSFGAQGELHAEAAEATGLRAGTPVAYRAGDQPNNAFSLNVLEAGEVAATAGTSGVVYGVSDRVRYDPESRVNTFAHVNHTADQTRLGVLLCVNGTGIMNAWTRRLLGAEANYVAMDKWAAEAPVGCEGLSALTFGNGAERLLRNRTLGAHLCGIDLNRHDRTHVCRAVQEGMVFAFRYGLDVMRTVGVEPSVIRAGRANMFQSAVFRTALADTVGAVIELYDTDGSLGAARGAGLGAAAYRTPAEAFAGLESVGTDEPQADRRPAYEEAYQRWLGRLETMLASTEAKD